MTTRDLHITRVQLPEDGEEMRRMRIINQNFKQLADAIERLKLEAWPTPGDHGELEGLGDDDHPALVPVDGSRPLTADWEAGPDHGIKLPWVQYDTEWVDGHEIGRLQWNADDGTLEFGLPGGEVNLQIGQEVLVRVKNASGGDMANGAVVYASGAAAGLLEVGLADATNQRKSSQVAVLTEAILNGGTGYATLIGLVRGLNTAAWDFGDVLYLSETTPGAMTNVRPGPGFTTAQIGYVVEVDGAVGTIAAKPLIAENASQHHYFNGAIIETIDIDIYEDTGTIYLDLEQQGGGNLSAYFDAVRYALDTTPAIAVALTAGTDAVPQLNYVYLTEALGVLSLEANTTGWPATSYAPVATVLCQSAATLANDGAMKVHAWTDHIAKVTENGHSQHINRWIRQRPAQWESGVLAGDMTTSDPDAYFSFGSGTVFQLHSHDMPALDLNGHHAYVVNDPTTAYLRIVSLDDLTQDASGNAINNKYMNIVMWGVVSEKTGDCQMMLNLPTDLYNTEAAGEADGSQYAVYDIPQAYAGVGFLIARYVVQAKSSGLWVQALKEDLRGKFPSLVAGGGGGGGAETFLGLTDTPASYAGEAGKYTRVNAGEDALEFVAPPGGASPLTTKGDVYTYDTGDARLPVGADDELLAADSGEATGLKWVPAPAGSSPLTTKGDLHVYDTDDNRLPVGTDDHVLTADSAAATGVSWKAGGGGGGGSPPTDFDLLTDGVGELVYVGGDVLWIIY